MQVFERLKDANSQSGLKTLTASKTEHDAKEGGWPRSPFDLRKGSVRPIRQKGAAAVSVKDGSASPKDGSDRRGQ